MRKTKAIMEGNDLESFVDRIIQEKKLENMDEGVLAEMKADLMGRVEDHINAGVLAALPSESLPEFEKLIDAGDVDKITAFCREQIPDFETRLVSILLNFRNSYLGL